MSGHSRSKLTPIAFLQTLVSQMVKEVKRRAARDMEAKYMQQALTQFQGNIVEVAHETAFV